MANTHREKAEAFEWFNLCHSSVVSLACLHELPEKSLLKESSSSFSKSNLVSLSPLVTWISLVRLWRFPNVEIKSTALLEGSISSLLHAHISVSISGFSLLDSALNISHLGSISAVLQSCSSLESVNVKVLLHHMQCKCYWFLWSNDLRRWNNCNFKKLLINFKFLTNNSNPRRKWVKFQYLLFHHYA